MAIHATFVGRVIDAPKQFGNLVVIRAVSNDGDKYEPNFVDLKFKADGYDGPNALKYQKGDDVLVVGQLKTQKWKNGKGQSLVMEFGRLETPKAIRARGSEDLEGDGSSGGKSGGDDAVDSDPFAGIPA
jgi:hypothetical protein